MHARSPRRLGAALFCACLGVACGSANSGGGGTPDGGTSSAGFAFQEDFTWKGDHAATLGGGAGSTVWWNPDAWDARGDTVPLASDVTNMETTGYHTDIHKAKSADVSNGDEDNATYVVGGDGSPGVAAMRLDGEDITSARLRNTVVIEAEDKPAIVAFRASRFVTTGHWWEVAISPATRVVGGEMTAVPGNAANCDGVHECDDGLHGPTADTNPKVNTAGPGHRPCEESINVITTGFPDIPDCPDSHIGFHFRVGVKAKIGGGPTIDSWDPVNDVSELPLTSPAEINVLYAWRLEFRPSGIDLFADFDQNDSFSYHQHFAQPIPWREVHVHFMGIAYEADHHPQLGCGWQGRTRELNWRAVRVSPLKYRRTSLAPRNGVTDNVARRTGWLAYDLRDIQRFGPPVAGVRQANDGAYSQTSSLVCASYDVGDNVTPVRNQLDLTLNIDADEHTAVAARFLYDIKGRGTPTLSINGTPVGTLPAATTVPGAATPGAPMEQSDFLWMWVQRDLPFDPKLLNVGSNTLHLTFDGPLALDRMQIELSYL